MGILSSGENFSVARSLKLYIFTPQLLMLQVPLCTAALLFNSLVFASVCMQTCQLSDQFFSASATVGQQQVGQLGLVQLEYFRAPKLFATLRNGLLDVRRGFQDCMYRMRARQPTVELAGQVSTSISCNAGCWRCRSQCLRSRNDVTLQLDVVHMFCSVQNCCNFARDRLQFRP